MEYNCKKCNGNKFAVYTKDNGCVFGICVQCGTETEEEYISAKDYFNKIVLDVVQSNILTNKKKE